MRSEFRGKSDDFRAVIPACLLLSGLIMLVPSEHIQVTFCPYFVPLLIGYAIITAYTLARGGFDLSKRRAFGIGLSTLVVSFIAAIPSYVARSIRIPSITAVGLIVAAGICEVAHRQRMGSTAEKRLAFAIDLPSAKWKSYSLKDKVLTVVLGASIIIAAAFLVTIFVITREGDRFTEFYILNKDGRADHYPSLLNTSEQGRVIIGIANHELTGLNYTVQVLLITVRFVYNQTTGLNDTLEISNLTLSNFSIQLEDGAKSERPFDFSISNMGNYKLSFLLFRNLDERNAYRSVYLFVTVV